MTHHTGAERAEFELMREAYEKAFGPPPVGAAWASVGYAIKTHEASEARAYCERFKGFIAGWVARRAPAAPVPQGWKPVQIELLERIQESLGSFLSDQGWSQSDMDTADALDGLLAAAPQPPVPQVTPEMIEAAEEAYMPFGDMGLALCAALQVAPIPPGAAPVQLPENIREGEPYDNPAFEALARALGVWGTAQSAVCAQFWIAAKEQST